jgi:hypothetical protein
VKETTINRKGQSPNLLQSLSLVPKLETSFKYIICIIHVLHSFYRVGNNVLWPMTSTVHSTKAVLPPEHDICTAK